MHVCGRCKHIMEPGHICPPPEYIEARDRLINEAADADRGEDYDTAPKSRIKLSDDIQAWLRTILSTERIMVLYDSTDESFYLQRKDGTPLTRTEVDGTEDFFGRRQ